LDYGRRFTAYHPLIVELRRMLDEETERRAVQGDRDHRSVTAT